MGEIVENLLSAFHLNILMASITIIDWRLKIIAKVGKGESISMIIMCVNCKRFIDYVGKDIFHQSDLVQSPEIGLVLSIKYKPEK